MKTHHLFPTLLLATTLLTTGCVTNKTQPVAPVQSTTTATTEEVHRMPVPATTESTTTTVSH